jgi:hypothetical protein
MWLGFRWDEQAKQVSIGLRNNSKLLPPVPRELQFRLAAQEKRPSAVFDGNPLDLPLQES